MRIYRVCSDTHLNSDSVVFGNIFNYEYFSDNINLISLNSKLELIDSTNHNHGKAYLNNADISLLDGVGGCLVYRYGDVFEYLIDIDYDVCSNYPGLIFDLFRHFRDIIKRDLQISNILND